MEFYGPRLDRLEDCHVCPNDIEMTQAEALEAMIIHRDCHPVTCSRQLEAARMVGVENDKYAVTSNVIPFPIAHDASPHR
ncbi:hypothetical protein JK358_37920 [Nocardia sp. 2]|uniref:Uncharacterized protein n=1 Tax=Nocardia acididurans TaxID=2802282 RepID=A0ABS1MHY2_9NOCA|nr:hypothetical protein [Nocardia acididurans]MBL1080189.1 hypothetical protein [Nocardia acididurans]